MRRFLKYSFFAVVIISIAIYSFLWFQVKNNLSNLENICKTSKEISCSSVEVNQSLFDFGYILKDVTFYDSFAIKGKDRVKFSFMTKKLEVKSNILLKKIKIYLNKGYEVGVKDNKSTLYLKAQNETFLQTVTLKNSMWFDYFNKGKSAHTGIFDLLYNNLRSYEIHAQMYNYNIAEGKKPAMQINGETSYFKFTNLGNKEQIKLSLEHDSKNIQFINLSLAERLKVYDKKDAVSIGLVRFLKHLEKSEVEYNRGKVIIQSNFNKDLNILKDDLVFEVQVPYLESKSNLSENHIKDLELRLEKKKTDVNVKFSCEEDFMIMPQFDQLYQGLILDFIDLFYTESLENYKKLVKLPAKSRDVAKEMKIALNIRVAKAAKMFLENHPFSFAKWGKRNSKANISVNLTDVLFDQPKKTKFKDCSIFYSQTLPEGQFILLDGSYSNEKKAKPLEFTFKVKPYESVVNFFAVVDSYWQASKNNTKLTKELLKKQQINKAKYINKLLRKNKHVEIKGDLLVAKYKD